MSEAQGPVGGRFEIGELVHTGRTGEVFRAKDLTSGATVAVKRVSPKVFASPIERQRTERELTQLSTLQSERIATIIAHGLDGEYLWVAMEWAEGRPLHTLVKELGPLPSANAAQLIELVCKGLGDAATVAVIHRDLAAKNVLVAKDGSIKLINFSIPVPGQGGSGVPEFMSPEQAEGKPVDLRSNIYSVGALLYFLIAGRPPFAGEAKAVLLQHRTSAPQPLDVAASTCSKAVAEVVQRALEKSPAKRFMTLPQLVTTLSAAVSTVRAPKPPEEASPSATQPLGKAGASGPARAAGGKGKAAMPAKTLLGMPALQGGGKPAQDDGGVTEPMEVQAEPEAAEPSAGGTARLGEPEVRAAVPATRGPSGKVRVTGIDDTAPADIVAEAAAKAPAVVVEPAKVPAVVVEPAKAPAVVVEPAKVPAVVVEPAKAPAVADDATTPVPTLAAPSAAEPRAAQVPSVGKKSTGKSKVLSDEPRSNKGKFRETMWFKKGELDAAAAAAAAAAAQQSGDALQADRADSLPIEDRYTDDGSITRGDREQHSLRTSGTQTNQSLAISESQARRALGDDSVTEADLISDLQKGRGLIIAGIVVGLLLLIGLIVMLAS